MHSGTNFAHKIIIANSPVGFLGEFAVNNNHLLTIPPRLCPEAVVMTKKRKLDGQQPDWPDSSKMQRSNYGRQQAGAKKRPTSLATDLPDLPPLTADMSNVVFTHQSAVGNKANQAQHASYERLEFVGDAYIELMATRLVWDRFKDLPAGRLSQIREMLVKNETLGEIAVLYGLDKQISATPDVKNNPKLWAKVKGDLLEAYVAAIVSVDDEVGGTGYVAAEKWLHQLWHRKLGDTISEKPPNLNAKDALSRKVRGRGVELEYREERPMKRLDGGQQTYYMAVFLTGWGFDKERLGRGQGLNKTSAGNLAAEVALQNPLTERAAEKKRAYAEGMKGHRENGAAMGDTVKSEAPEIQDRTTRERKMVEKKRSMFMSTEFG